MSIVSRAFSVPFAVRCTFAPAWSRIDCALTVVGEPGADGMSPISRLPLVAVKVAFAAAFTVVCCRSETLLPAVPLTFRAAVIVAPVVVMLPPATMITSSPVLVTVPLVIVMSMPLVIETSKGALMTEPAAATTLSAEFSVTAPPVETIW